MLGTISSITPEQLRTLLSAPWHRRIREVHVHHTWRPRHADWAGKSTVEAIRRYHMEHQGWSDIAQHLTLGPDGSLWTGRHLDRAPASAVGFNGNSVEGPLMIEMVGDFDIGQDPFGGAQAQTAYATVAMICDHWNLAAEQIRFHHEFNSGKSCPGTSIDQAAFRAEVAKRRVAAGARGMRAAASRYLARIARDEAPARALDGAETEPAYDAQQAAWFAAQGGRGLFDAPFPEPDRELFRRHVVDLAGGALSDSGEWCNSEQDIERLADHVAQWVGKPEHKKKKARILFYAHGGLVSERSALEYCLRNADWWLENDVYPIFFVWETGFFEVFRQFPSAAERGFTDWTDALLEATLGPTVGTPAWNRMKQSAVLASVDQGPNGRPGGANFFVTTLLDRLKPLIKGANAPIVEFHAMGHSAGSILHAHLLPMLVRQAAASPPFAGKAPAVASVTYLAPAMRGDLYLQQIDPLVRSGAIGAVTMFTMRREAEEDDDVVTIYRKSLLYFVRNACENGDGPPILGLQESVYGTPALMAALGLDPSQPRSNVAVVFGPTKGTGANDASDAEHHPDFDDDSPTLNSALGRILGGDPIRVAHVDSPKRGLLEQLTDGTGVRLPMLREPLVDGSSRTGALSLIDRSSRNEANATRASSAGRRHALCIGIDQYPDKPLTGCVADANRWAATLKAHAFSVTVVTDQQATRSRIIGAIDTLLSGCAAGDVAVIQYSGHGTQIEDRNRDESDGFDEAWVASDYRQGGLVIDDDLGRLFDRHQNRGIELVLFTDCCHSATNTRLMLFGGSTLNRPNSRFLQLDAASARAFDERHGAQARQPGRAPDALGWEIHFAACQDHQSAMEHAGHGDFTTAACDLLERMDGKANYGQLADRIHAAFQGNVEQMPNFRGRAGVRARALFGPAARPASGGGAGHGNGAGYGSGLGPKRAPTRSDEADDGVLQRLDRLTESIDKLTAEVRKL